MDEQQREAAEELTYYSPSCGWPLTPRLRAQFDVMFEREAQEFEFGDVADDLLTPPEWIARLAKHLGRAVSADPAVYRHELVVVGALALAGIEAFDRREET